MNKVFLILLLATLPLRAFADGRVTPVAADDTATAATAEVDDDSSVLTPEEEAQFYQDYFDMEIMNVGRAAVFKFPQTVWNECSEEITGNYYGYACVKKRGIAVILKTYIDSYIYDCIDAGLAAQGGGTVNELHIVHDGILGDANHVSKSLHSQNRAIDIKAFQVKLTNGKLKNFDYMTTANHPFYTAFRTCWGKTIHAHNGCPYYQNNPTLTASIGWENAQHHDHLHMSVPYCVGGKYSPLYYEK